MADTIRILAQVADNEPTQLAEAPIPEGEGPEAVRETARLLHMVANLMDDIVTMHQLNAELDRWP